MAKVGEEPEIPPFYWNFNPGGSYNAMADPAYFAAKSKYEEDVRNRDLRQREAEQEALLQEKAGAVAPLARSVRQGDLGGCRQHLSAQQREKSAVGLFPSAPLPRRGQPLRQCARSNAKVRKNSWSTKRLRVASRSACRSSDVLSRRRTSRAKDSSDLERRATTARCRLTSLRTWAAWTSIPSTLRSSNDLFIHAHATRPASR